MTLKITQTGEISGYASLFNALDHDHDIVLPGAFDETLREWRATGRFTPMLWQHDTTAPIGVWTGFTVDAKGLLAKGRLLIETVDRAREAHALAVAGAVTGLSIGYRVGQARRDARRGARLLSHIKLYEVSLVTFPALDGARVSMVKKLHQRS